LIKKLTKISLRESLQLAEAILTSAIVRFLIFFIPLKKFAAALGKLSAEHQLQRGKGSNHAKEIRLKKAIQRTSIIVPWRFMCYEQAFTAKIMMRRRNMNSWLHFGVHKDPLTGELIAHAWLKSNHNIITGAAGSLLVKTIAVFK